MITFGYKIPCRLFSEGSCFVVGRKGSGKDVMFGNVIARRKIDYVSNLDYNEINNKHVPYNVLSFNVKDIDLPVTYRDFLHDTLKYYSCPYPKGTDVYISDGGCFFPNFEVLKLNKEYPGVVYFVMLSRQLNRTNVHINTQAYCRIWDKFREQFHYYILCKKVRWFKNLFPSLFGHIPILKQLCLQTYVVYERATSIETEALEFRVKPPRKRLIRGGAADETAKQAWEAQKLMHETNFGKVKKYHTFFINKSFHDSYFYERKFKNAKKA